MRLVKKIAPHGEYQIVKVDKARQLVLKGRFLPIGRIARWGVEAGAGRARTG